MSSTLQNKSIDSIEVRGRRKDPIEHMCCVYMIIYIFFSRSHRHKKPRGFSEKGLRRLFLGPNSLPPLEFSSAAALLIDAHHFLEDQLLTQRPNIL